MELSQSHMESHIISLSFLCFLILSYIILKHCVTETEHVTLSFNIVINYCIRMHSLPDNQIYRK